MILEQFFQSFESGLATGSLWSPLIALLAGIVASGVCPCTLPVGLGIAGLVNSGSQENTSRKGLWISFAFFTGIVVNLTILGALAGSLGILLTESFGSYWAIGMAIISFFAGIIAFSRPRMKVSQFAKLRKPGISGAFIYGFVFSLGTSAAPLLLLLTVAATQGNPILGLFLAFAFGIGRGLPFLAVGIFAGAISKLVRLAWLRKSIQILSGSALLFVSFYYVRVFFTLIE